MSKIITEEMRYRQKVCEYALKHGVTKAARRYHTYRQFVYRQLERYDGTYSWQPRFSFTKTGNKSQGPQERRTVFDTSHAKKKWRVWSGGSVCTMSF